MAWWPPASSRRPVTSQSLEAGKSFGGVWADSPTNAVVYKNLQTNLPTVVMQSPDLDFDASCPRTSTSGSSVAHREVRRHFWRGAAR